MREGQGYPCWCHDKMMLIFKLEYHRQSRQRFVTARFSQMPLSVRHIYIYIYTCVCMRVIYGLCPETTSLIYSYIEHMSNSYNSTHIQNEYICNAKENQYTWCFQ